MVVANGRIATSNLSALPKVFSNKREREHLTKAAYASLVRMMLRACADTGSYFSVWDAYRSFPEQVAMLKKNYYPSSSGDRTYAGQKWRRRSGRPRTASPGYSNHGNGVAVDIHPGAIQSWLKGNAARFGWVNDVPSESWHWSYLNPGSDQYRAEGLPDVKAMQKALGVEADGKPGPGTAKAVKAFQAKHKLTADGIPGLKTVEALLGKGSAPVVSKPAGKPKPKPVEAATDYKVERHQTKNLRVNRVDEKRGLTGSLKAITIHHWGSDGQKFANVVSWLIADGNGNNQSSAHEVIEDGRVAILADAKDGTWNSGNSQGNLDNYALECRPEATAGDIATVAARVAAIRAEHGDLPIDVHADYVATACPGRYKDLIAEIDALARGGTVNLGRPIVTPAKAKGVTVDGRFGHSTVRAFQRYLNKHHGAKLKVDGKAGHEFWKALQRAVGAPYVDGVIDRQSYKADELGNGITQGWKYTGRNSEGSQTISLVQHWVGVKRDGILYEGTTTAIQRKLNTYDLG